MAEGGWIVGAHRGWSVGRQGGRWVARVLVGPGKYRAKGHASQAAAKAWAQDEAAKLRAGVPSVLEAGKVVTRDLVALYVRNLDARGRSESHVRNVRRTLDAIADLVPDLAARTAGTAIETWLDARGRDPAGRGGDAPVAGSTRNRRLVEVRALCRWAMRRDLLLRDPTRAIERATEGDALRPQFGLGELAALVAWPAVDVAARRRLGLLLYAGLRADEAAAMTWSDVDLVGGVLLVRVHAGHRLKRGRERIVPIQGELRAILGDPGQPAAKVAPWAPGNGRRAWPVYLARCCVTVDGRSQHSLRHAYAGLMTATGVPGPLLSAYLGHSSAATTMLYTRLAARYVGAVAAWPRGALRILSAQG